MRDTNGRGAAGRFSAELAAFVAGSQLAALGERTRADCRAVIVDALACALAGSSAPAALSARPGSSGLGGAGPAIVLGTRDTTTAARAAFLNGGHVHGLNYDANGPSGGHVGLVALVPALAVSGDKKAGGADLLVAGAVAAEVADRLAAAARFGGSEIRGRRDGGWLLGQVIGYLAAAAGAARALGLGAEATRSAFGLALMQTAGTKQVMIEGDAPAKGLYGGFACLGGVLAAELAASGVEADVSALEGDAGLMGVFFDAGAPALEAAFVGLGDEWAIERSALKSWPASGVVQPYVDAAAAVAGAPFAPEAIGAVVLHGRPQERDWFEPVEARRHPDNPSAAGNSVCFGAVCGLVHGGLLLADVLAPRSAGADLHALSSRTEHRLDGERRIEVFLTDGARLEASCVSGWRAPSQWRDGLAAKLRDANAQAADPLADGDLAELAARLEHLEEEPDAAALFSSRTALSH